MTTSKVITLLSAGLIVCLACGDQAMPEDEVSADGDASVPSGDGESSDKALQRVFSPVADTYIDASRSTTNFGKATELGVDNAPDVQRALIRFTVPVMSEAVQGAKLRLFVANGSANGPRIVLTDNSWTETGVTYATRPT